MSRRLLFILIGVAALVIPVVIAAFVINRTPRLRNAVLKLGNVNVSSNVNAIAANTNVSGTVNSPSADRTQIKFVSRNFAETYGSGSNQNNAGNIVDAEKWATASLTTTLNSQIAQQRATQTVTPYHGILTTALVMNITKQTTTTAVVAVSTQRQETIDR